jgi:NADPH-dependent curcumin reductase CurA
MKGSTTRTEEKALKRLAPDGITIYYENVGGEHLEAAGMVSQYNLPEEKQSHCAT